MPAIARHLHWEHAAISGDADVLVSLAELYAAEGDLSSAKRLLSQARSAGRDIADKYLTLVDHERGLACRPAVEAVRATTNESDTDGVNFLGLHALYHGSRQVARSWWAQSAAAGDIIATLLIAQTDQSG